MWKVVPICDYQKLDVRPEDLLDSGDFRKCETYRGGGGYDQFPKICKKCANLIMPTTLDLRMLKSFKILWEKQ